MDLWNVYLSHVSFSTSRVDTLSPSAVHIIEEKLVIFLCLFNTNVSETLSSIMVVYDEGFFRSLGSFVGAIQEDTPWKHLFSKCWIVITVSEIALINHRQLLWHTDENKRPPKHPCFPLEQRTQPSDNSAPTALVLTQAQKSWEHGALSLSLSFSLSLTVQEVGSVAGTFFCAPWEESHMVTSAPRLRAGPGPSSESGNETQMWQLCISSRGNDIAQGPRRAPKRRKIWPCFKSHSVRIWAGILFHSLFNKYRSYRFLLALISSFTRS